MAIPVLSDAMRMMFERGSTLALARLEKILNDPKSSNKEVIEVAKLYLSRTAPEPKIDSAASASRTTLMIGPSQTVAQIMEKGKARLGRESALLVEPEPMTINKEEQDNDE